VAKHGLFLERKDVLVLKHYYNRSMEKDHIIHLIYAYKAVDKTQHSFLIQEFNK
jgi:hypothetical protein